MRAITNTRLARVTGPVGLLALLSWMSCTDVTGSDHVSGIGILEHFENPPLIEAPTNAIVGEPVEIAIETYGGLGCVLLGETMIRRVSDLKYEVTPFDLFVIPAPGSACPSRLVTQRHVVNLSFDRPGVGRVVVRGRTYAGGVPSQSGEIIELERALTVTID